jgi:hypothetical protein
MADLNREVSMAAILSTVLSFLLEIDAVKARKFPRGEQAGANSRREVPVQGMWLLPEIPLDENTVLSSRFSCLPSHTNFEAI